MTDMPCSHTPNFCPMEREVFVFRFFLAWHRTQKNTYNINDSFNAGFWFGSGSVRYFIFLFSSLFFCIFFFFIHLAFWSVLRSFAAAAVRLSVCRYALAPATVMYTYIHTRNVTSVLRRSWFFWFWAWRSLRNCVWDRKRLLGFAVSLSADH